MARNIGRPQKYAVILWSLPDDELFTPAKITARAAALGLIEPPAVGEPDMLPKQRIRMTMGRLGHNHGFPAYGDGLVRIPGQAPTAGWYGRRWKVAAQPLDDADFERLAAALTRFSDDERAAILDKVARR